MSAVTKHERPGVYSSYEASSLTAAAAGGGNVAVGAAVGKTGVGGGYQWTSYSRGAAGGGGGAPSRMGPGGPPQGAGRG